MRDFVKACFDIAFDDPSETRECRVMATSYRVVRTPIGSEPVGVIVEFDLEDRFQRHSYRLLHDLVPQARDSELGHFAVSLGYLHTP